MLVFGNLQPQAFNKFPTTITFITTFPMKHPYLAKLLFLLLFAGIWLLLSSAFAQTGSVSGRVTDSKNEGIPGATVLIEGTSLGSSSNVDGTYSIQNVPAGPHTVVISFVGYNTVRRPVTVVAGQNAEVSAGADREHHPAGRGRGGGLRHPAPAGRDRGRGHG